MGARQAHRPGAGHVHGRPGGDPGGVGAVVAGGEDVRQHREIADLRHGLVLVGELQQVEVRVRDHHVFGLAADPAAHVHVSVGRAGTVGVDVQADAGLALLAVPAAAAGDVERGADQVADLDELDVGPGLDDLAGDLVAEHQALRRGRAAAHHVLVTAADVGGDDPEDHSVRDLPADVRRVDARPVLQLQLRVVDRLDFHVPRLDVGDGPVSWHGVPPSASFAAGPR